MRTGFRLHPTISPPVTLRDEITDVNDEDCQNSWTWRPGYLESQIKREPNWDEAPEWAEWWAVDRDGQDFWYEKKPSLGAGDWVSAGRNQFGLFHPYSDWRASLRQRPTPVQKSDAEIIAELKAELAKKEEEIKKLQCHKSDPLIVNWANICDGYDWVAKDRDGDWYAFAIKPQLENEDDAWSYSNPTLVHYLLSRGEIKGNCDWRESLHHRPG